MSGLRAGLSSKRVICAGPSSLPSPRVVTKGGQKSRLNTRNSRSLWTKSIKRYTSFWAHSYAPSSSPQIPFTPPMPPNVPNVPPGVSSGPSRLAEGEEPAKKEKKQRYLDSLMDKAGELSLRCSVLDAEGNWTAEEGRYKKAELCKQYDLDPRDLRKLDSMRPNLVPIILTRRTCILISILHIRALIKPDRVIIFDTAGTVESEVQKRFKYHLEKNIKAGLGCDGERDMISEDEAALSYEHRALESILVATANALEEEMTFVRKLVQQLLADLEDDINRDNLKRLLHYSRRMVGFQSRARYVKRAVDEVLDNDEDLSAMYLTSRAQGKPRAVHDHEQLELLLESFVKQVEEIVSEVDNTVANMQSTQEIAELMLDSGRNALLALDIKISIATLGVGTGALIAGFFGMNLATQLEQTPYAFITVTGSAALLATLVFVYGIRILRRVRRVALSGQGPPSFASQPITFPMHMLPNVDPLTGAPRPHFTNGSTSRRISMLQWFWARKRNRQNEPVWMNEKADIARAKDAMRAAQMAERARQIDMRKDWAKLREEKLNKWKSSTGGDDVGDDMWDRWESGPWKWGRGKAKWAKE